MNIKDVERITGLKKANIRYYEQEGLLQPSGIGRTTTGSTISKISKHSKGLSCCVCLRFRFARFERFKEEKLLSMK